MINLQKKENFINDQMENNLNISEKSKINLNKGYFVSDKAPLRLKKRAQEKIHVEVEKMRFQCSSQNLIRGHKNDLNCKIEINRNAKIEVSEKEPKFLKRNYSLFLTKNDCLESDEKLLLYKKNLSNSRGNSKIYCTSKNSTNNSTSLFYNKKPINSNFKVVGKIGSPLDKKINQDAIDEIEDPKISDYDNIVLEKKKTSVLDSDKNLPFFSKNLVKNLKNWKETEKSKEFKSGSFNLQMVSLK